MTNTYSQFMKELKTIVKSKGFKIDFRVHKTIDNFNLKYFDVQLVIEEMYKLIESKLDTSLSHTYKLDWEVENIRTQSLKDYIESTLSRIENQEEIVFK
ncbi:TPA: hypothetical protein I7114_04355 [Vibrio vulnificus]|uniref:hypothetical protein n=1 Tax=Vibrio diabolicus TaxID=50719 RepID=UPI0004F2D549|nr:hypothetical protein [Vibrio diabolicus]HAS6065946.1 hypothetical protein [Vibrio vulnificus]